MYLISYIIEIPIYLLNFFIVLWSDRKKRSWWRTINGYFYSGAVSRDKFSNYNYRRGLNLWLTRSHSDKQGVNTEPYKFGNPTETISSALGKNQRQRTLSLFGWVIVCLLWAVDVKKWFKRGHCFNSINDSIQ